MNDQHDSNAISPGTLKRSTARRWMLAAAVVAALGAPGIAGASIAADAVGGMHGGHHYAMNPADAAKHIDKMIDKIAPDATPQQKARLTEIAKSAFADLHPVHAQLRDAHKRAHDLLMQPVIDRVALEALRAEQVQRFDAISKRALTAVEDASDILTPEQRARFAEHMQKRHH